MHADVFRFPEHPNLFAAVVGSGTQMTAMTFAIFGLALVRRRHKYPTPYTGPGSCTYPTTFAIFGLALVRRRHKYPIPYTLYWYRVLRVPYDLRHLRAGPGAPPPLVVR